MFYSANSLNAHSYVITMRIGSPATLSGYPRICTNSFAAFICRVVQLDPTVSVLEADDRVLCQDRDHTIYQYASIVFIVVVSCGVPIGVGIVLYREYRRLPSVSQSLEAHVSDALGISIHEAGPAVHDITMGSAYGFLVDAFKPQYFLSESMGAGRDALCFPAYMYF